MAWSSFDAGVAKRMRQQAEKLVAEAGHINNMVYPKSRKTRAEKIRKQLGKIDLICGAISRDGKICTNEPVKDDQGEVVNGRCKLHGGMNTGPKTEEGKKRALANLDPRANLIHGLYSRFVMSAEEMDFYAGMMNYYLNELDLDPANMLLLDRALRNFILNQRKEIAAEHEIVDETDSYNDYDTKFMRYMQALGLDRKFNVSKDHKDNASQADITMLFMGDDKEG